MEEFRTLFLCLCKENGIDPQEGILQRIQDISTENVGMLDLSNSTINVMTCTVLGKVLAHDLAFTSVVLSDCMLNEEGAKSLLSGLAKNSVIKILDLRGNNLRQTGAEAIGRYLKENHTLDTLLLEWNSLGVWESSFASLCEGISANVTLKHLDLRNNQIDHVGAQELAIALRSNNTLVTLDLRWNNIGLIGGRSISEALQQNHGVAKIDVAGNNIPRDVLTSIEASAMHNEDRAHSAYDQMQKTRTLTNEIQFLKSEKKKQMISLLDDVDLARSQLDATNKASSNKINHLQEALEERKAALNALRAKLDMCEASLVLSDQKLNDQGALLELSRKENLDLVRNYEGQIKREREGRLANETKLHKDLEITQDTLSEANSKISDLERNVKNQQDQILSLKENIAHLKSEQRIALSNADERLASDRRRMQIEARELEEVRMRDMERLRNEMDEARRAADDRAEKMRLSRDDLAREITELNANMAQERLDHDDALRTMRSQLKAEENIHSEQLQERIRTLISEKSEVQRHVSSLSTELAEVEASRSAASVENEGLKRALDGVKRHLATKDQDCEDQINHVKNGFKKRVQQLEEENSQVAALRAQILTLETQLNTQAGAHRDALREREHTIDRLTENLRRCEAEAERAREEEIKRASALQQAVLAYVQGAGHSSPRRL